jgi:hypothetical protein
MDQYSDQWRASLNTLIPNAVTEWLHLLLCIHEAPGIVGGVVLHSVHVVSKESRRLVFPELKF